MMNDNIKNVICIVSRSDGSDSQSQLNFFCQKKTFKLCLIQLPLLPLLFLNQLIKLLFYQEMVT
jgi:hypothetical protein